MDNYRAVLERNPVIAAVKDEAAIERFLRSDCELAFVLFGNILTIGDICHRIMAEGKMALIHVDLVEGLSSRDIVIDFLAEQTGADGYISTRPNLVKRAHTLGFLAIQRFFLLDSMSVANADRQLLWDYADCMEVIPGVIPRHIAKLAADAKKPVIAGGLIHDKQDILAALAAGAAAVSTSREELWEV